MSVIVNFNDLSFLAVYILNIASEIHLILYKGLVMYK